MENISNPFQEHPIDLCCSRDELRPFINYIYFMDGIAYACNASVLLALSLKDIDADPQLIKCLDGYKMHYEDMQFMNGYQRLFPEENGKLYLNDEYTRFLKLHPFDYPDEGKGFKTIFDAIQKVKAELKSHSEPIANIKIGLYLIEKIGKSVGFLNSARFRFLKNPSRVFLEFDNYKNSYALVMGMKDDEL